MPIALYRLPFADGAVWVGILPSMICRWKLCRLLLPMECCGTNLADGTLPMGISISILKVAHSMDSADEMLADLEDLAD